MHSGGPNRDKPAPLVFPGRARVGTAANDRGDQRSKSRTLQAAAGVGLLASALLTAIFLMLSGSLAGHGDRLDVILQRSPAVLGTAAALVPFAAVAFLWFMAAVRDQVGEREDRLIATLLLGSGLLFLSGLFLLAAVTAGVVTASQPPAASDPGMARFVRAAAYNIAHDYIVKTSIVFMIATSTLILRARSAPRPFAFAGYGAAIAMLFGSYFSDDVFLAMPLWIALISLHILFGRSAQQR